MSFIEVFMWLIMGHFLFDFPLQNDFLAIKKKPIINRQRNPIWVWCLSAHSILHAIPVMWLTGKVELALVVIVTHFAIDYIKCKEWITFQVDQMLHLTVLGYISLYLVYF